MTAFIHIVLLFFMYSLIGWLWETFYCSLKAGKFVYRGFLLGPYCPIYGFGVLSVLYFVEPYQNNIGVLFIFSAVVVSVLEYLTSYVLEKLFHASWWDYTNVPLNIHGRIALPISLFWGIACVFVVKIVQPKIMDVVDFLTEKFGVMLPILLILIILADLVYTVTNMVAFQQALSKWSSYIEAGKLELQEKMAEHSEAQSEGKMPIHQQLASYIEGKHPSKQVLPKLNLNQRRILRNFNNFKVKEVHNLEEIKATLKELRQKNK